MKASLRAQCVTMLDRLAVEWPVGAKVRHVSGWVGEIVDSPPTKPDDTPGLVRNGSHAVLDRPAAGECLYAVRVRRIENGQPVTAWFAPRVLSPASHRHEPRPARVRTRGRNS